MQGPARRISQAAETNAHQLTPKALTDAQETTASNSLKYGFGGAVQGEAQRGSALRRGRGFVVRRRRR